MFPNETHMEVITRPLLKEDYAGLKSAMIQAYDGMFGIWREANIERLLDIFPEGQFCVEVDGKVVACALSIIVQYGLFGDDHTYEEITGDFTFTTHSEEGDVLYGIEIFVHPDFRQLRLARRLYDARKELCENLNLKEIKVGGRIPNYHLYSDQMSPKQYIQKVKAKEIYDPVLSFQLANDFHVVKVLTHYLKGDEQSKEYAVLLEWNNIYYSKTKNTLNDSIIRIGLAQWQMRPFSNLEKFYEQVVFFVDVLSEYKSDFAVFPEFFNSPLLAEFDHLSEHEAMRELAKKTPAIQQKLSEYAIAYNVNIIAGSLPLVEDGHLYNISYLCHRNGKLSAYRKIHITPNEVKHYGIKGGDAIHTIPTDCGKVGILICYDVEFPELSRLMALQGMKILFVPYLTDTQHAYMRVRHCAMARAIENECFVAITGCVGNLPGIKNMDIQFGQAAVFTPSDFAFPMNAIKAEATPNTEMTLIADVDLNLLKELHHYGSVRTLSDRRTDLYDLKMRKKLF